MQTSIENLEPQKTHFSLAEFAELDMIMPHKSRVFNSRVQIENKKRTNREKEERTQEKNPKKKKRSEKKRRTHRRSEDEKTLGRRSGWRKTLGGTMKKNTSWAIWLEKNAGWSDEEEYKTRTNSRKKKRNKMVELESEKL